MRRRTATLLAACLSIVVLGGCAGARGDPVVRVAGKPITKGEVDHFMSVVAAGASTNPGQAKFQTPQPPDYTMCIAYLKRYPTFGSLAGKGGDSHAALKFDCEFEYRKERLKALYILVGAEWVSGEAAELGVTVSDRELGKALAAFERQRFPTGSFQDYLASQRLTLADIEMEIKESLLVEAVQHKLESRPSMRGLTTRQRQRVLERFGRAYERKWKARTTCQRGYIVPICREYIPPKTPSALVPNAIPLTDLAAE